MLLSGQLANTPVQSSAAPRRCEVQGAGWEVPVPRTDSRRTRVLELVGCEAHQQRGLADARVADQQDLPPHGVVSAQRRRDEQLRRTMRSRHTVCCPCEDKAPVSRAPALGGARGRTLMR